MAPPDHLDPDGPPAADPVPFPEELLRPAVAAAARLWEPLAARAWAETAQRGRGLLALRWDELKAAAAELEAGEAGAADQAGEPPHALDVQPPATWIPLTIVSRGDDFRGLLKEYDPRRQVMLLVAHDGGGEAVFGLECDGDVRPAPEACHARWIRRHAGDPAAPEDPGAPAAD